MEERKIDQNKEGSELKTITVPLSLGRIKENITIRTNILSKRSREQIINQAFKFHSQGNILEATKHYQMLINQGCNDHRVFSNYGAILKGLGKLKEAELATLKAIELNPDFAKEHLNLGTILRDLGKLKEAEISYRKAIKIKPDFTEAYYNLGTILKELGKLKEAEISYRKAIKIKPDFTDAYYNLGNVLLDMHDLVEAEFSYRKAIEIKPDYAKAHLNLATILKNNGNLVEAEFSCRKAIELKPDSAELYSNLGTILKDLDNLKEAEFSCRKAIELKPDYAEAHSNLGTILKDLGNLQEAELSYRKAIEIDPKLEDTKYNLSFILLKKKNFKEGWIRYESRWEREGLTKLIRTSKPHWRKKKRGTVLLWPEQGLGDTVLFSSLIPELVKKVDQLIVMTDKRLIPLFKRSFVKKIKYVDKNDFVDEEVYDYQISMGSLPKIFRPSNESFNEVPQKLLKADKAKTQIYRKKLIANNHKKIVGISWNTINKLYAKSSIPLEELLSVIYSSEMRFVSLQYGDVQEEIYNAKLKHGLEIFEIEELDNFYDIDGLAALINACDEIITIDNITAQLAGALGVSTKVILNTNSYWPHGIDDKQSSWFPSIRFFRQIKRDEWREPLVEIKNDIII